MRILYYITLVLTGFILTTSGSDAAIDMTVSPLKYEIEGEPGQTLTYTATLFNNDIASVNILTGKSDFKSDGTTGSPSFVRYSELVHQDQELSSWISLSSSGFTIGANTSHTINFTVSIPANATPGGHYGAVFFKNNGSESSGGSKIGINVDYGVLILLTVSGKIETEITITDPIITGGGGGSSGNNNGGTTGGNGGGGPINGNLTGGGGIGVNSGKDQCLYDFTNSNYDGKCYDNPIEAIEDLVSGEVESGVGENEGTLDLTSATEINRGSDNNSSGNNTNGGNEDNGSGNEEDGGNENNGNLDENDFEINFTFPVINTGNTHVKPEGSITLVDEDGKEIKGVGKMPKINDQGAVIGMEVVDYIPINSGRGNVLPGSTRNFEVEWKGFPYQTLDDDGKIVMKDMSPNKYYTNKNIGEGKVMMPWERLCHKRNEKTITAYIKMAYENDDGELVEYSSAKEIPVTYDEKYIGFNPYVIIPFLLFGIIFMLLWFIALGKRRKCINKDCKKRIKRKLERCPHCDEKQKKFSSKKKKKSKK